jgi:hypothetical protein
VAIAELQIRQIAFSLMIQHLATNQRLPSATIKIDGFPVLDNMSLDGIACVDCTFAGYDLTGMYADLELQFRFYSGLAAVKSAGSLQQPPTQTANHSICQFPDPVWVFPSYFNTTGTGPNPANPNAVSASGGIGYVAKFSALTSSGTSLVYSTYFGEARASVGAATSAAWQQTQAEMPISPERRTPRTFPQRRAHGRQHATQISCLLFATRTAMLPS